jgi:hypothetical protein
MWKTLESIPIISYQLEEHTPKGRETISYRSNPTKAKEELSRPINQAMAVEFQPEKL